MAESINESYSLKVSFKPKRCFYVNIEKNDTIDDLVLKVKKKRNIKEDDTLFFNLCFDNGNVFLDAETQPEDKMKKVTEIISMDHDGKLEEIFMVYQNVSIFSNTSNSNRIKLWNACSEVLFCDVEYEINGTWVNKRMVDINGSLSGDSSINLNGKFQRKTEENFSNEGTKSVLQSDIDIDAHNLKKVYIDERLIGNHVQIRVFKKKDKGGKEEVEVLPIKPGQEYILYTHGNDGSVRSGKKANLFWHDPWTVTNGKKCFTCDPHDCLKKGHQCKICPHIPVKNGAKVEVKHLEPHRSLQPGTECSVCTFTNTLKFGN